MRTEGTIGLVASTAILHGTKTVGGGVHGESLGSTDTAS